MKRIGMLTPSSNTALESATYGLLARLPWATMDLLEIEKAPLHHAGMLFRY